MRETSLNISLLYLSVQNSFYPFTLDKMPDPLPLPISRQVWAPMQSQLGRRFLYHDVISLLKSFPRLSLPPNLLLPSTKGVSYLVTHPVGQIRGRLERRYISLPLPHGPLGSTCLQSVCVQLRSLQHGNVGPLSPATGKPCGFPHCRTEVKFCLILEETIEGPLLTNTQATFSDSSILVIKLPFRIKISVVWIPNGGELAWRQGRWKGFGISVDWIYTNYG